MEQRINSLVDAQTLDKIFTSKVCCRVNGNNHAYIHANRRFGKVVISWLV